MAQKTHKTKGPAGIHVKNKKAYRDFELLEKVEAGMELLGTEVKSLRDHGGDLEGSYARIIRDECWLIGCKIAPYAQAAHNNHEPERNRKLLLHKRQAELALATGKRQYDKRQKIQQREQTREVERSMKKFRR